MWKEEEKGMKISNIFVKSSPNVARLLQKALINILIK